MRYRLQFHGRTKGAIGIFYDTSCIVTADNEAEALERLYDTHERGFGGHWGASIKVTMLGEDDEP